MVDLDKLKKRSENWKTINTQVEEKYHAKLIRLCNKHDITISRLLRHIVVEYINKLDEKKGNK